MALDVRRYYFHDYGSTAWGEAGEIPGLQAIENDPLPSIALARSIERCEIYPDEPLRTKIRAKWFVAEPKVMMGVYCEVSDPRIARQYADPESKSVLDRTMNLIGDYIAGRHNADKLLTIGKEVSLSQVPDVYQPYFQQITRWTNLVEPLNRWAKYRGVMEDDHYVLFLCAHDVALTGDERVQFAYRSTEFFQPGDEKPSMSKDGDYVFWKRGEPDNIIYGLAHDASTAAIAEYYGYFDVWQQHMSAKAAKNQALDDASERYRIQQDRTRTDVSNKMKAQLEKLNSGEV